MEAMHLGLLEFLFKSIAASVALAGSYIAFMKWLDQRKRDSQTAKVEAERPFSIKQQEIYVDIVMTTSIIANEWIEEARRDAERRFWILYWGMVPLVADEDVSRAVDACSELIYDKKYGTLLCNASMNLARACRRSMGDSWNVNIQHFDVTKRRDLGPLAGTARTVT